MNTQIRPLTSDDMPFLREVFYHAVYVPPGAAPVPHDIIDKPELAKYIVDFGSQPGDAGVIALVGEVPVGAAWARLIHGYGFVDLQTPELSIAVLPGYRRQGIGTQLMRALLDAVAPTTSQISPSVQLANPAYRLYQRLGFRVVSSNDDALMVYRFLEPP
jgi:ribosomal protein S18 acetylase RimI-like enzyme